MSGWTPGPWTRDALDVIGSDKTRICRLGVGLECDPHNAHLIAAAPEMYEALYICIQQLRRLGDAFLANKAEEVLAKARGEPT